MRFQRGKNPISALRFFSLTKSRKQCILRVPTVVGRGARVPHHRRERADLLQNSTARIKYRKNGYSIHMHAIAGPAANVAFSLSYEAEHSFCTRLLKPRRVDSLLFLFESTFSGLLSRFMKLQQAVSEDHWRSSCTRVESIGKLDRLPTRLCKLMVVNDVCSCGPKATSTPHAYVIL